MRQLVAALARSTPAFARQGAPTRFDVWTDAGRVEGAQLYPIAANLSATEAFAMLRVLRRAGWEVELLAPEPGLGPAAVRPRGPVQ